jgi:lysine 2,3-aminomutase
VRHESVASGARVQAGYSYLRRPLYEPDWRRLPGWRDVTDSQWRDAQWQRVHCVKGERGLRAVIGDLLADSIYREIAGDQRLFATMPILITPQMLNTMFASEIDGGFTEEFLENPVRRYMLPILSDRDPEWPSHPVAQRDSLHEAEMWAVEGLTHRYPTKVLVELVTTCPQYCGHCTRMDLVGTSTPQVAKARMNLTPADRQERMIDYLRRTPSVRDVVVSGGDVANVPWPRLEAFLLCLLDLESVRDIRLATKALVGLPQHWLQDHVREGLARVARVAADRGVNLAVHTHANHARSVTPLVAEAARAMLDAGLRNIRNQGVLMRGVNATATDILDLCFTLQDEANIAPYYFYLCDMIPSSEHWRTSLGEARDLQEEIMGYLPGYATPRIVCDVPYLGKRWTHQYDEYDAERGVSYWSEKSPAKSAGVPSRRFTYYDPIHSLPESGRRWWAERVSSSPDDEFASKECGCAAR